MEQNIIAGPAVTFDPAALRVWLAQVTDEHGTTRAEELGYDNGGPEYVLPALDSLLDALRDDSEQTVWWLSDAVENVDIWQTYDGECCNGALVVVDVHVGLRLSSLHQEHKYFTVREGDGLDAAEAALSNVAWEANTVVGQYLGQLAAARGQVTETVDPADMRANRADRVAAVRAAFAELAQVDATAAYELWRDDLVGVLQGAGPCLVVTPVDDSDEDADTGVLLCPNCGRRGQGVTAIDWVVRETSAEDPGGVDRDGKSVGFPYQGGDFHGLTYMCAGCDEVVRLPEGWIEL